MTPLPEETQTKAQPEVPIKELVYLPSEKEFAELLKNDAPTSSSGIDGYQVTVPYSVYSK